MGGDNLSRIGKYFVDVGSKLKIGSPLEMIESFKSMFKRFQKHEIPESEMADFAEWAVEIGVDKIDEILEASTKSINATGEFLFNNYHQGTFKNKTKSLAYHLSKHGKGRSASKYVQDSLDFFEKNRHLGTSVILDDGSPGISIKTKILNAAGKSVRVGGFWTATGKLVTFWD